MAFLHNDVSDGALAVLSSFDLLHLCDTEPATYAAVAGATVGNKTGLSFGAAANGAPNGRQRSIAAFTGGNVTATSADSTLFWVGVDTATSRILFSLPVTGGQLVTSGNTFQTTSDIVIRIPAAA